MTTSTRRLLTTGLSIATTLGMVMCVHALAEDPLPTDPPSSEAAPAGREEFLLLNDGRLIQGVVSREGSVYVVTKPIGVMRFPKKIVEGKYESLQATYEHKLVQLPDDDPAERVKLAKWCVANNLIPEANEQLHKVLEISPDHGPAQAMLSQLAVSDRSKAKRFDPAVRQTAAEDVVEDRPGAHDSAVLRGAERGMGVSGLPVIFDLPRTLAIRRADEFARFIHPVLQLKCAKCHNAGYEGTFQLVPVATAKQLTADALRANMDATLRLIDPENPSKSELLSSTLRPHGSGPRKRPIFEGSNSRAYQILAVWVNSLSAQSPRRDRAMKPGAGDTAVDSERFASDRSRPAGSSLEGAIPGLAPADGRGVKPNALDPRMNPAFRFKPGQGWENEDLMKADPAEFPLPYMLGGPKPAPRKNAAGIEMKSATPEPMPKTSMGELPPLPQSDPKLKKVSGTDAGSAVVNAVPSTANDPGAIKKPKKSAKIDPAILEKLLKRNADRTAEQ